MNLRQQIERIVAFLELLGAVATSLAMLGCFAYGIVGIIHGLIAAIRGALTGTNASGPILIDTTLTGLELLFLAPLPFLAFISTTRLYRAMTGQNPDRLETAHELVVQTKRLITSLMIAVVSTELIHRIISGAELSLNSTAGMLGLIVALSLFYWASAPKLAIEKRQ